MPDEDILRKLEARDGDLHELDAELVAVTLREGAEPAGPAAAADAWLGGALSRAVRDDAVTGEEDEVTFFAAPEGDRPHVLAIGLGEVDRPGPREARRAAGLAAREARRRRVDTFALSLPDGGGTGGAARVEAAAQGLVLGDWAFLELLGPGNREDRPPAPSRAVVHAPTLPDGASDRVRRGGIAAKAQNFARGLVARPGNVATPRYLASRAREMEDSHGLSVEAWGPDRLREEGFGGLLAVSRGSAEEPRFLVLEHAGDGGRPCVLVGKGVTFDSGGISLKPAKGMEEMKYDMGGAAAVMGAVRGAAELGLERRVVGLVPATENLPSGTALKPADVIRGISGISIEVVNTDAEGRLILSDALAYAERYDPAAVVDLATLTGGCVVALGHHAAGLMSPDDDLATEIEAAGERADERVWRLPLWDPYREQLESEIADIKNSGGREASAVTAGMFLREFTGDYRWAHLDIAGTAWANEEGPCQPKGATGTGVRLLLEWLVAAD